MSSWWGGLLVCQIITCGPVKGNILDTIFRNISRLKPSEWSFSVGNCLVRNCINWRNPSLELYPCSIAFLGLDAFITFSLETTVSSSIMGTKQFPSRIFWQTLFWADRILLTSTFSRHSVTRDLPSVGHPAFLANSNDFIFITPASFLAQLLIGPPDCKMTPWIKFETCTFCKWYEADIAPAWNIYS